MKHLLTYLFCLFCVCVFSQEEKKTTNSTIDVNYFTGNIALHNNDILHLIQGHPEGFIISWNKKTFGEEAWQERYNYPDYGFSFGTELETGAATQPQRDAIRFRTTIRLKRQARFLSDASSLQRKAAASC